MSLCHGFCLLQFCSPFFGFIRLVPGFIEGDRPICRHGVIRRIYTHQNYCFLSPSIVSDQYRRAAYSDQESIRKVDLLLIKAFTVELRLVCLATSNPLGIVYKQSAYFQQLRCIFPLRQIVVPDQLRRKHRYNCLTAVSATSNNTIWQARCFAS
jgi:hypothetical protein